MRYSTLVQQLCAEVAKRSSPRYFDMSQPDFDKSLKGDPVGQTLTVVDGYLVAVQPHPKFKPDSMCYEYDVYLIRNSEGKPMLASNYKAYINKSYTRSKYNFRFTVQMGHGGVEGAFLHSIFCVLRVHLTSWKQVQTLSNHRAVWRVLDGVYNYREIPDFFGRNPHIKLTPAIIKKVVALGKIRDWDTFEEVVSARFGRDFMYVLQRAYVNAGYRSIPPDFSQEKFAWVTLQGYIKHTLPAYKGIIK